MLPPQTFGLGDPGRPPSFSECPSTLYHTDTTSFLSTGSSSHWSSALLGHRVGRPPGMERKGPEIRREDHRKEPRSSGRRRRTKVSRGGDGVVWTGRSDTKVRRTCFVDRTGGVGL